VLSKFNNWPRPVIGVPMERVVSQEAFYGFVRLAKREHSWFELAYSLRNDRARDKFSRMLLDSNFTHLIMLDSDHVHQDDTVERLMKWVEVDPGIQVIGGLNYRRVEPFNPCAFLPDGKGGVLSLVEWPKGLMKLENEHGPGWIGTGNICISRDVFERIPPPWWCFDYSGYDDDQWPGVDMFFSDLCHKHAIDIWLDTTLTAPHLMTVGIDGGSYTSYMKRSDKEVTKSEMVIKGHLDV